MNYWTGVFCGFITALLFFIFCFFAVSYRVNRLQDDFDELRAEHDKLSEWVEANEITMKTYGFLNEQVTKLLEEKKK